MRAQLVYLVAMLGLFLVGCGRPDYVARSRAEVEKGLWLANRTISMEVPVPDTVNRYDLTFLLTHNGDYPYSNLYLLVELTGEEGRLVDTLEYTLAMPDGRWLGSQFVSAHRLVLPYRRGVRFSSVSGYRLNCRHGMRADTLVGLESIELLIQEERPGGTEE